MLPADTHAHTEWSWDAPGAAMDGSCARAVRLGLPAVSFTDHADLLPWVLPPGERIPAALRSPDDDRVLVPPPLDAAGRRAALDACRARHPGLTVRSGVELSDPHRAPDRAAAVLRGGDFERVAAAVHSLPTACGDGWTEVSVRFADTSPARVLRGYLAETVRMLAAFDAFAVLAHLNYPARYWPRDAAVPYDTRDFEPGYRTALRALARTGRALEINTRAAPDALLAHWWRAEGGRLIAFGSDAHRPGDIGRDFHRAAALAARAGFRPARPAERSAAGDGDFWVAG